jgi:phage/plasmid-like protein (TIGR03299 family)
MSFQILETPVRFMAESAGPLGSIKTFADQKVLYRSDTQDACRSSPNRYQVVQPSEVLEFYRDLTQVAGYELGNRRGAERRRSGHWHAPVNPLHSEGNDLVQGYLLLATSCDGTLATTATPTTVRVVCNNTLTIAVNGAVSAIKVPHNTRFDAQAVKQQLGIAVSQWDGFMYRMRTLAERKVKSHEAMAYFLRVLCEVDPNSSRSVEPDQRTCACEGAIALRRPGSWCRTGSSQRNGMDYSTPSPSTSITSAVPAVRNTALTPPGSAKELSSSSVRSIRH